MAAHQQEINVDGENDLESNPVSDIAVQLSHLLTSGTHLISNILTYLNARELNTCARVCKLWSRVVKNLKGHRKTRAWTFIGEKNDDRESREKIYDTTKEFLHGLYTEPSVLFMFCSTDFNESSVTVDMNNPSSPERKAKPSFGTYGDFVRFLKPKDCQFIPVCAPGVVGTDSNMKQVFEWENDTGVAFLCLPHDDSFSVIETTLSEYNESGECQDAIYRASSDLCSNVPDHTACKAILNFVAEPDVPRSVLFDLKKDFENAVLAGGMIDSLASQDNEAAMQVALCGHNIDVGCVVIRETIHTKAKAEEKIKELKSYNLSEEISFAFMFACVGRGKGFWGETGVESKLFHEHFPKTPLLGFFGNGEIGMDHVTKVPERADYCKEPSVKKLKKNHKLFHSYTTIIMLVSFR